MSGFLQGLLSRHATELAVRPRAASPFEFGTLPFGSSEPAGVSAAASLETHLRLGAPETDPTRAAMVDEPSAAWRPPSHAERRRLERPPGKPEPTGARENARPSERPASDRGHGSDRPSSAEGARSFMNLAEAANARSSLSIPGVGPLRIAPRIPLPAVRMLEPLSRRAETAEPAPREPDVVHVHIGRVEVRAMMADSERPRSTTPRTSVPRPLSLDRYLAGKRDG